MEYKSYLKTSKNQLLVLVQKEQEFVANGVKTEHVAAGLLRTFRAQLQLRANCDVFIHYPGDC